MREFISKNPLILALTSFMFAALFIGALFSLFYFFRLDLRAIGFLSLPFGVFITGRMYALSHYEVMPARTRNLTALILVSIQFTLALMVYDKYGKNYAFEAWVAAVLLIDIVFFFLYIFLFKISGSALGEETSEQPS